MSIEPLASARSRMPVLPRPCLWVAAMPCAASVWVTISPSTYDSVKRFEPTFSGSSAPPAAALNPNRSHAQTLATKSPVAVGGQRIISPILAGRAENRQAGVGMVRHGDGLLSRTAAASERADCEGGLRLQALRCASMRQ